jgi:hypothetical protein
VIRNKRVILRRGKSQSLVLLSTSFFPPFHGAGRLNDLILGFFRSGNSVHVSPDWQKKESAQRLSGVRVSFRFRLLKTLAALSVRRGGVCLVSRLYGPPFERKLDFKQIFLQDIYLWDHFWSKIFLFLHHISSRTLQFELAVPATPIVCFPRIRNIYNLLDESGQRMIFQLLSERSMSIIFMLAALIPSFSGWSRGQEKPFLFAGNHASALYRKTSQQEIIHPTQRR